MFVRLQVPKLSKFDRPAEPVTVAVPFSAGGLAPDTPVVVRDERRSYPTQARPTATWPDGSVKWLLVDALLDLPGNASAEFTLDEGVSPTADGSVLSISTAGAAGVDSGRLSLRLCHSGQRGLIREMALNGASFADADEMVGPELMVGGEVCVASVDAESWRVVEPGPVRVVLEAQGSHISDEGRASLDFVVRVTAWAGKPWVQVHHRLVNREAETVQIDALNWRLQPKIAERERSEGAITVSNYRSSTQSADPGTTVRRTIDAEYLLYTSNEQVPEVNYGTFTGHWRHPERGGLSATIFQAYQNFPAGLSAGADGLAVELVPEGSCGLSLMPGMAKGYRFLLHAHDGSEPVEELVIRGLQYQMPDRPLLDAETYRRAKVLPNLFVDRPVRRVERKLLDLADNRTRAYGALHWGDAPEIGYTHQGRGRGQLVWCNMEYDLPRAAMVMFARTGERRMLDYLLVSAEHWMEVDVCHHSDDPLRHQGMVCHSACHVTGGVTISHEWVEGILDYYHQTGDEFALQTALGIGSNVLRHLDRMMSRGVGAFAARETGWAIRTLVALYEETHDEDWLAPAEVIVGHFEEWMGEYDTWLSPYTDHTLVRVPFMITVAVNGLMCYYRVRPQPRVERMVVQAMDDLIEHCLMPDGRFYYKELPSLQKRGAGTQVLQGLAYAYSLTADDRYLRAGMDSFELSLEEESPGWTGGKYVDGDAVIEARGPGPKAFASAFPPIARFYRCAVEAGLLAQDQ